MIPTTVLLIRHGSHDLLGKTLAGRMPGVSLNAQGRAEADHLAEQLRPKGIAAVYTSPLERAKETAWPLARRLGLKPRVDDAFHEIDFGDWTGRDFSDLHPDAGWQLWNSSRSAARPPNGETIEAVRQRVVAGMERLQSEHPAQTVAVVSHGDAIKTALMHCLGIPADNILRFEVSPGSVSEVMLFGGGNPLVASVNHTFGFGHHG